MTNLEELKNLNKRLTGLLEDPQPGLFTWHDALADVLLQISTFSSAPEPISKKSLIRAEAHSDDFAFRVDFDAGFWFEKATDKAIIDLIQCGFRGDYPADEVAIFMAKYDPRVRGLFGYIEATNAVHDIGFECAVDPDDAINWIEKHRPALVSIIDEAKRAEVIY